MARDISNAKNYNNAYIYNLYNYKDLIMQALTQGERIDATSPKFENVLFAVKQRQTTSVLVDVLRSKNVVLIRLNKALPLAFNVFSAKDLSKDGKMRTFIDVTDTITEKDGFYTAKNIDRLVAQLVSAMTYHIYFADPKRITTNQNLVLHSTQAFTDLFCYVLDYLRISGFKENRDRVRFLIATYYLVGMMWKDANQSTMNIAMKVANIDKRKADICDMFLTDPETQLKDIDNFIKFIAKSFKLNDLTTEVFLDRANFLYGVGTHFSWEIVPAFLKLITDAFSGSYIVRQNTIEKVIGKQIVEVTQDIFTIGTAAMKK